MGREEYKSNRIAHNVSRSSRRKKKKPRNSTGRGILSFFREKKALGRTQVNEEKRRGRKKRERKGRLKARREN